MPQLSTYPVATSVVAADQFPIQQASSASLKLVTLTTLVSAITSAITTGTGFISSQVAVVLTVADANIPNAQVLASLTTGLVKVTTTTGILSTAISGTDYAAPGSYITGLTGDVTAAGPGSAAATIAALAVTNAKIANSTIVLTTKVTGILPAANGGTGVANASNITMGGAVTFSGAFTTAITVTNNTAVTLPISGTLATLAGVETFTNKTLTSPKIGTSILDTNGNILLTLTATGTAVNGVTYANAATGGSPTFTASGTDGNIGMVLSSKGTSIVRIISPSVNPGGVTIDSTAGSSIAIFALNNVAKSRYGVSVGADGLITGSVAGDICAVSLTSGNMLFSVDNGTTATLTITASTGAVVSKASIKSNSATLGIGYATGAGGTVSQGTSKATAFTLSKVSGQITTFNDNLAAGTIVSAVWTNTAIAATDIVMINHVSGGTVGSYSFNVQCGAGTATLNIRNNTAGGLAEALVLQYIVIKGVNA